MEQNYSLSFSAFELLKFSGLLIIRSVEIALYPGEDGMPATDAIPLNHVALCLIDKSE